LEEEMNLDSSRLKEFDHYLSTVRSVRRRINFDKQIDDSVILECINIAVQAPTGRGDEGWRFLVVKNRGLKERVAFIYEEVLLSFIAEVGTPMKKSHQALIDRLSDFPSLIFVCKEGVPETSFASQAAYFGSVLPAAWSLMVALRSRGIGSTWTTLLSSRHEEVAEVLGMPSSARQVVMLPVGYTLGAVLKKADRKDAATVSFLDSWGIPFTD
tara:strand:+ start:39 stop:677 length:639 start_codon:yes stop_codon:yes gene_type:complete